MATPSTVPSVSDQEPQTQSAERSGPHIIDTPEENASAYEERAPEGKDLYDRLAAPFDVHFQDERSGVKVTYITGEQVASRLNLVLGLGCWKYTLPEQGYDQDADEMWSLGRLEALIDGVWVVREQYGSAKVKRSKPPCGYMADHESGELCGHRAAEHGTGRDRISDHRYLELGRGQPLDIGFDKKAAATDALKKCATLYGIGLYLLAKKGGVRNETSAPAQRRAPAQPRQIRDEQPPASTVSAAPSQIRCKQPICTAALEGVLERCGDVNLVHPKNASHEFVEGDCGVTIERTEIDGKVLEPFKFVNDYTMKRFKKPYCRRHYDAHVAVEERR